MEEQVIAPVEKRSLSDDLARQIKQLIDTRMYKAGHRLPTIAEMARLFGVGHPTLREALKKLETVGVVTVRHGSGIYVAEQHDMLFVSNPISTHSVDKKMLLDIIETRVPLELMSIALAADHITDDRLSSLRALLDKAEAHLQDDHILNTTNMAFHREIAAASGNAVLPQVLDVMSRLFTQQQQIILRIYGSRSRDHDQHLKILEALEKKDRALAVRRMRHHLDDVRIAIELWDPEKMPLNAS